MRYRNFYLPSIETTIVPHDRGFYRFKPMKTMGDRIADRLDELKKSQRWLADLVGIKQPSLNKVIRGKSGEGTKHVVSIAKHLGLRPDYLEFGTGQRLAKAAREALLVGHIGAGAEVIRIEEGVVLEGGIEPPAGHDRALAARIKGSSMYPLEEGWLIFYAEEHRGVPERAVNRLCAVGLADGRIYIKKLRRDGGKRFRLESWNAEPIENAKVLWASEVLEIRPR